jgi:hypothetical protein
MDSVFFANSGTENITMNLGKMEIDRQRRQSQSAQVFCHREIPSTSAVPRPRHPPDSDCGWVISITPSFFENPSPGVIAVVQDF